MIYILATCRELAVWFLVKFGCPNRAEGSSLTVVIGAKRTRSDIFIASNTYQWMNSLSACVSVTRHIVGMFIYYFPICNSLSCCSYICAKNNATNFTGGAWRVRCFPLNNFLVSKLMLGFVIRSFIIVMKCHFIILHFHSAHCPNDQKKLTAWPTVWNQKTLNSQQCAKS